MHGFDERYDLVPQWASVKRGIYERMEAGAKDCLKARAATSCNYRIRVSYSDLTTLTPDTSTTDVQVDTEAHPAQSIQLTIPNRALDNSE